MKKFIAVLLAVLAVVSLCSLAFGAIAGGEETHLYAIVYTAGPASPVRMLYSPTTTYSFSGPGTLKVSSDTPIAIDHDFVCWQDDAGNDYYPGQPIYVDREIYLTPVFVQKTDNDIYTTRVLKAFFQTVVRVLQKAFGIFKDLQEFNADP